MDLTLTEEQHAFIGASRRMLERVCSTEIVREAATPGGPGHSKEVWQCLADAGWLGMPFAADFDGAAAPLFDLGLAYREAGRVLVPTTLYSTILAGMFITSVGTVEQKERWLRPLCRGDLIGTVALSEAHAFENLDLISTTAESSAGGWVLNGEKAFVANAGVADVTLVLARVGKDDHRPRFGVFATPSGAPGVQIDAYLTFGQDALFEMKLDHCELPGDALLGGVGTAGPWRVLCEPPLRNARALQCMEMLGGIEAVLDRTVRYVSQRHQFGVPIGSFQAVQHHLANIAMRLEAGRVAAFRALWAASERADPEREITIAELWLRETYVEATLIAHQVWGGMGYALDSGLYLWSQRAKTLDLVCGRKATRYEQLLSEAQAG